MENTHTSIGLRNAFSLTTLVIILTDLQMAYLDSIQAFSLTQSTRVNINTTLFSICVTEMLGFDLSMAHWMRI